MDNFTKYLSREDSEAKEKVSLLHKKLYFKLRYLYDSSSMLTY
jgi:hypothetical protein